MLFLRAIARLVGALLMAAIALVGLGTALYCFDRLISIGSARPDRLLDLPSVRAEVGTFLTRVGASGPTAAIALVCGVGAIVIGGLLLLGIFGSGRQRTALLRRTDVGELAVSARTLRTMIRAMAARVDGITAVRRPDVALRRRGSGGRVTVPVVTNRTADPQAIRDSVRVALEPVTDPLELRTRVRARPGESGQRVQ